MRDVYIVAAARTAIGKTRRALALTNPIEWGAEVLKSLVERAGNIDPALIDDVTMGCANPEGETGMNVARMLVIRAGFPDTVPAMTINRFCSSGMESIMLSAAKIRSGMYDVAIAGGLEGMSFIPLVGNKLAVNPWLSENRCDIYTNMGCCGDNVARDFKISREDLDEFAYNSVMKALAAIDAGKFKSQIVPLQAIQPDGSTKTFDTDEGPRRGTTIEGLAKLRPAFAPSPKIGVCTAGNSSQTSDGAAGVLLMSEEAVKKTGAKPIAKVLGYNVAADKPCYLGPAQIPAINKALKLSGITLDDIGLVENNEAFASQCMHVIREMNIPMEKVNVNGGAIALGHPLGCTGAKLTTQILHDMMDRKEKYGLVTMCIGGGLGAGGVYELCD